MINSADVIVVGAGPSGLMAASCAAARGLSVLVLEKQPYAGAKFCYSGMGAAPVSNTKIDVSRFHGRNARFVSDALAALPLPGLRKWFADAGLQLEDAPYYGIVQAPGGGGEVIEALGQHLEAWHDSQHVTGIERAADGFVVTRESDTPLKAKAVVLATGAANLPQLGGSNDGCRIAQSLGHSTEAETAALVPISVAEGWVTKIPGVWMDVGLQVMHGKRSLASSVGSMLFTGSGLTGEVVFNVSRVIEPALSAGAELELAVNFHPNLSAEDVAQWMFRVFGERSREPVDRTIDHILPARLGIELLRRQKVKRGARVMQMDERQREGLLREMLDTRLKVRGTLGLRAAEGVSGGVNVREVDPRTFESKLVPNLFMVGQLLDVQGEWGGFEQHFSLASGWLAGHSVLKNSD